MMSQRDFAMRMRWYERWLFSAILKTLILFFLLFIKCWCIISARESFGVCHHTICCAKQTLWHFIKLVSLWQFLERRERAYDKLFAISRHLHEMMRIVFIRRPLDRKLQWQTGLWFADKSSPNKVMVSDIFIIAYLNLKVQSISAWRIYEVK